MIDIDCSQIDSEMHFEESCNITNMTSYSNDFNQNTENMYNNNNNKNLIFN
jgi:hypothetical protein